MPHHGPCPDSVGKVQPKVSPENRLTTWPEAAWRCPGVWFSPRMAQEDDYRSVALLGKRPHQCQGTLDSVENTESSPPPTPTTEPRHGGQCGSRQVWVQISARCLSKEWPWTIRRTPLIASFPIHKNLRSLCP